ncbi:MAG TPA: hypothetical protein VIO57_05660 [Chloroflexota bacterium]
MVSVAALDGDVPGGDQPLGLRVPKRISDRTGAGVERRAVLHPAEALQEAIEQRHEAELSEDQDQRAPE